MEDWLPKARECSRSITLHSQFFFSSSRCYSLSICLSATSSSVLSSYPSAISFVPDPISLPLFHSPSVSLLPSHFFHSHCIPDFFPFLPYSLYLSTNFSLCSSILSINHLFRHRIFNFYLLSTLSISRRFHSRCISNSFFPLRETLIYLLSPYVRDLFFLCLPIHRPFPTLHSQFLFPYSIHLPYLSTSFS